MMRARTVLATSCLAVMLGCGASDNGVDEAVDASPMTTPRLDSEHPGWRATDCDRCHNLPLEYHSTVDTSACAACHGGNGACAIAELPDHDEATDCVDCHGNQHSFSLPSECVSCHYAYTGVLPCQ